MVDGERVYVKKQYEEENQTASMIARRLLDQGEAYDIEKELAQAQTALAITLSERQKQAVRMVFQNQISIITGGPGTGKTTVLKVILYIHAIVCRSQVQLMAPSFISMPLSADHRYSSWLLRGVRHAGWRKAPGMSTPQRCTWLWGFWVTLPIMKTQ